MDMMAGRLLVRVGSGVLLPSFWESFYIASESSMVRRKRTSLVVTQLYKQVRKRDIFYLTSSHDDL